MAFKPLAQRPKLRPLPSIADKGTTSFAPKKIVKRPRKSMTDSRPRGVLY